MQWTEMQNQKLNHVRLVVLSPEVTEDPRGSAPAAVGSGLDPEIDSAFDNLIKTIIKTMSRGGNTVLIYATLVSELVELQYQYDKILGGEGGS